MSVVLLSRDLMLLARAEGAARQVGVSLGNANDVAQAVQFATDPTCRGMVIDLRLPALNVGELVSQLRAARGNDLHVVACGPHVHEASLTAAREAGCDLVATRGQFERDAEVIFQSML